MKVPFHHLPARTFAALAAGRGGPAAIAALAAVRSSRDRLLAHALLELAKKAGGEQAAIVKDAYATLVAVEAWDREAVAAVLDYPTVSAWLLRTALQLDQGRVDEATPGWLSSVAAAAVVRSAVTATVEITSIDGALTLPTLGVAEYDGRARVVSSPREAILETGRGAVDLRAGGDGWRSLPRLTAEHRGLRLEILADNWESGWFGTTPVVPAERIGTRWREILAQGWRILAAHRPEAAEEVACALRTLIPLRGDGVHQASGTPQDAFGCMAMSLPLSPEMAAVTLTHEVQHTKLSALDDLIPLVDKNDDRTFHAPWRPDPRPALPLLHGIYAHLSVADFWRGRDEARFGRWQAAVVETAATLLGSGLLTPAGEFFVKGILERARSWD
ncbi:aKG-HExxH-type peptide beta-hydroxylase [Amycolatopsis pigmentata]|uniref:HEXXH motif-containing putative peptide modification protein n=1 Tax=Amycolatopsis pigmentata TaxID=450801 RepID=A0ABW5FZV4_9PSEU